MIAKYNGIILVNPCGVSVIFERLIVVTVTLYGL